MNVWLAKKNYKLTTKCYTEQEVRETRHKEHVTRYKLFYNTLKIYIQNINKNV